jgi:catechol 2,3-dioxygenase-like lactoylglutathione lyase family enzyme
MKMVVPLEVGICCADLEALAAFYIDVLGFTQVNVIEVPADVAARTGLCACSYRVTRLQTPYGERVKLLQPAKTPARRDRAEFILSEQNTTYLTFIVEGLPDFLSRLLDLGAEVLFGPEVIEVRPGTFLVFARDPEGNLLEFVEYADVAAYRSDLAETVEQ